MYQNNQLRKNNCIIFNNEIACEMLQFSTRENFNGMKTEALNFINENFKECLLSESFFMFGINALKEILKLYIIAVNEETSEVFIFDRLMDYASSKRATSSIRGSTKREILNDVIKLINFPSLSLSEFKSCVEKEPAFLKPEEILAIRNEIINGTKNSFGFSDLKRFHFDNKIPALNKKVFILYKGAGYFITKIQSFSTKFKMNKTFKLCGIQITLPKEKAEKQKHVKILVYDENQKVYLNQNFKIRTYCTSEDYYFKPIELNGDFEYTIQLKFPNSNADFEYWAYRTLPFKTSHGAYRVEFSEICLLMNSVYVL